MAIGYSLDFNLTLVDILNIIIQSLCIVGHRYF